MSTVLIVEDNPRNLKLVRDVLGHAGYETLEAPDAEAGLALAREKRPDLVLMDINLPGMTGVEALARAARRRVDGRDPRGGADRVRDEGRPRADPGRRLRRLPREAGRRARAAGAGRGAAEAVILVVDDLPQNVRLLRAVLEPRGHEVTEAVLGRGGPRAARAGRHRPRAARRADARHRRLRGLPADPRGPGDRVPARGDDHRLGRAGEAARDRGRCRRLRHEAVRPGRAAGARALAAEGQALPGRDRGLQPRAAALPAARGGRAGQGRPVRAGRAPARDRGHVLRAARASPRWPSRPSPRT